jgi:hypothetical protein
MLIKIARIIENAPLPTGTEITALFLRKMANDPDPDQPKEAPMIGG